MYFTKIICAILLCLGIAASSVSASAACTNATFKGSYGALEFGDKPPNYGVTLTHFEADGNGNLAGMVTYSVNGTITTNTFTGTYSVSKSCTGSYTIIFPNSQTARQDIVIDDAKKGFQMIRTDSGYAKAGFAVAEGTTPCGLPGKKATYSLNTAGSANGAGAVAAVGQLKLDGNGMLSGSETLSLNGSIFQEVGLSGTYSVNSDCTGSAQVAVSGFSTVGYNLVVISGGKGVLLISTDSGSIITGTMTE